MSLHGSHIFSNFASIIEQSSVSSSFIHSWAIIKYSTFLPSENFFCDMPNLVRVNELADLSTVYCYMRKKIFSAHLKTRLAVPYFWYGRHFWKFQKIWKKYPILQKFVAIAKEDSQNPSAITLGILFPIFDIDRKFIIRKVRRNKLILRTEN